jgi:hypothetical protein
MRRSFVLFVLLLLNTFTGKAQLKQVIVEKYYVSDAKDSTDITGGKLDSGSVTYRIFVEMQPGSILKSIYGDANHKLMFKSTKPFFNNTDRGETIGKDIPNNRFDENTVALDTWLTLGQVGKTAGGKTYAGVLKTQDSDGSIVGGVNNDGGSASIPGGMLTNADATAGTPITSADGLMPLSNAALNWFHYGILSVINSTDSSIFGSQNPDTTIFESYNAGLQNSGVNGINSSSNTVLIAQLTTAGEIEFEINLLIENSVGESIKYVADNTVLLEGEKMSGYLKYPFNLRCRCADPQYVEYTEDRDCDNADSCKNIIKFGCMDRLACNYDSTANYSVSFLCCYPGYCNDRDITVVCPSVGSILEVKLYPNPSSDKLTIEVPNGNSQVLSYSIIDSYGNTLFEKSLDANVGYMIEQIDVSLYNSGLYLLLVKRGDELKNVLFIKN